MQTIDLIWRDVDGFGLGSDVQEFMSVILRFGVRDIRDYTICQFCGLKTS